VYLYVDVGSGTECGEDERERLSTYRGARLDIVVCQGFAVRQGGAWNDELLFVCSEANLLLNHLFQFGNLCSKKRMKFVARSFQMFKL
jgi:hypothetical protein